MPTQSTSERFQCRHILTSGHRCGSPALKAEVFCFYHHTTRKPVARHDAQDRQGHQSTFDLPLPEDRSAIQYSIGEILRRIANHTIDPRRAGLILYGLQIAALNLPRLAPVPEPEDPAPIVEEFENHPVHGILAPEALLVEPVPELSVFGRILRDLDAQKTLPTVQGTAATPTRPAADLPVQSPRSTRKPHRSKTLRRKPGVGSARFRRTRTFRPRPAPATLAASPFPAPAPRTLAPETSGQPVAVGHSEMRPHAGLLSIPPSIMAGS